MSKIKLIAELSMNHLGNYDLIREMVQAAKDSGADYAKFQTWKVENLAPGPWDSDGRREDYIKSEMTEESHFLVKQICDNIGIGFLTSCFNHNDLEMIRRYSNIVKIPSTECTNIELVSNAIKMFDTVYMSVGASKKEEFIHYARFDNVYLLHCVSIYPCPYECANLSKIRDLQFYTPRVGYSGHCDGIEDAIAAIAMGARVVEKHFTTDRSLPFKDNKISIVPSQFSKIRRFRDVFEKMSIYKGTDVQELEKGTRELYARRWDCG